METLTTIWWATLLIASGVMALAMAGATAVFFYKLATDKL